MRVVVENIGALCTMSDAGVGPLGRIDNAVVHIEDERVVYAGPSESAPLFSSDALHVDAEGSAVLPGLVDCHTHLLFAGSRADEFALRSRGATYAEIMAAGGGIRNTMRAVRASSEGELVALGLARLDHMLSLGVTTCEVKSGYGLSVVDEVKSLRAIRALDREHAVDVVATCLAAHAIPPEFEGDAERYTALVVDEILPRVAEEKLAAFADVFVEQGAFSVEQGRRVLLAARDLGLDIRVHAEQLSNSGGAKLAAELGAKSAGHLEFANEDDIRALAGAGVIAEVLSSAQVFLGMQQRIPGKKLRDAGVRLAVATDYNPGSANVPDLQLAAGLAITMSGLSADDALVGITRNGALALGLSDRGVVEKGARADLVVLDTKSPYDLVYEWGRNPVRTVLKGGRIVVDRRA